VGDRRAAYRQIGARDTFRVSGTSPAITALRLVEEAGFRVALVGGWSRELLGLEPPRSHADVDLVVTDADMNALDGWLDTRDEIVAKRFPHKRAFRLDGTMIELHLVTRRTEQ
jgi:hypothetical protein